MRRREGDVLCSVVCGPFVSPFSAALISAQASRYAFLHNALYFEQFIRHRYILFYGQRGAVNETHQGYPKVTFIFKKESEPEATASSNLGYSSNPAEAVNRIARVELLSV